MSDTVTDGCDYIESCNFLKLLLVSTCECLLSVLRTDTLDWRRVSCLTLNYVNFLNYY